MAAPLPIPVVGAPELIAPAETGDNPRGGSGGLLRAVGCRTKTEVQECTQAAMGEGASNTLAPVSLMLSERLVHEQQSHGIESCITGQNAENGFHPR